MADSSTNMGLTRSRKFFLGANWKCNGTTAFVKDIISHMVNDFWYNPNQLGKLSFANHCCRFYGSTRHASFAPCTSHCVSKCLARGLELLSLRRGSFHWGSFNWRHQGLRYWIRFGRSLWKETVLRRVSRDSCLESQSRCWLFSQSGILYWRIRRTKRPRTDWRGPRLIIVSSKGGWNWLGQDYYCVWTSLGHGHWHYCVCWLNLRSMRVDQRLG